MTSELYVAQEPHTGPSAIGYSGLLSLMVVGYAVWLVTPLGYADKKHIPATLPVEAVMQVWNIDTWHLSENLFNVSL